MEKSREYFPDFLYKYVGDRNELAGEGYEGIQKLVDKILVDSPPVRTLEPPFFKKFMKNVWKAAGMGDTYGHPIKCGRSLRQATMILQDRFTGLTKDGMKWINSLNDDNLNSEIEKETNRLPRQIKEDLELNDWLIDFIASSGMSGQKEHNNLASLKGYLKAVETFNRWPKWTEARNIPGHQRIRIAIYFWHNALRLVEERPLREAERDLVKRRG